MNNKTDIYVCDDSVEGIFTAIYKAWEAGTSHTDIRCSSGTMNYSLFENYINIDADIDICRKVISSINTKLGNYIYGIIFTVISSCDNNKASVVYHSLQKLFKYGTGYINNINDEYIYSLFSINRKVSNEAHFYHEIVRFSENKSGILVARIKPDNNILYMIIEHFADRLHCENFVIYDTERNICYVHSDNGKGMVYTDSDRQMYNMINSYSDTDKQYEDLWVKFFETIAIKERGNERLQMNMLPLKYRKYLPEMN